MRWFLIACLLLGCSTKKDGPKTSTVESSHPAMPDQFEVGSTINERYLVTKKLGETGELAVFAVENVRQPDRKLTMVAPKTPAHSKALRDTVQAEMFDKKTIPWLDLDVTKDMRSYYAVGALTDEQVRDILSGAHVLVK